MSGKFNAAIFQQTSVSYENRERFFSCYDLFIESTPEYDLRVRCHSCSFKFNELKRVLSAVFDTEFSFTRSDKNTTTATLDPFG